jgi:hypothetical protein
MKTCLKCNKDKLPEDFYKFSSRKDGLTSYCKVCYKQIGSKSYQSNSSSYKENAKKWFENNRDKAKVIVYKKFKSIEPGVYMIKNLITGDSYIGQSTAPYRRRANHVSISEKKTAPLHVAVQKYGKEAFVFGIIEHCPEEELLNREEYYIQQFKPTYNTRLCQ